MEAVKIAVIESERGWGSKIDDWMICLNEEDARVFQKEFNSQNTSASAPDWYMQAEGDPAPIDISLVQFERLKTDKRVWWSTLKKM